MFQTRPAPPRRALSQRLRLGAVALAMCAAALAPARAASDPAMRGEVLVKLGSSSALSGVLVRHRLSLIDRFGARPIYRLRIVGEATVAEAVAELSLDPAVQIAEPNYRHSSPEGRKNNVWAIGTPDAYAAQWAIDSMRLPRAWRLSKGAGVRVAVLDTGIDSRHPAFSRRLLPGYDFVGGDNDPRERAGSTPGAYGHGTHVAGLIAKAAPRARIVPLRVLDGDGRGNAWVLAEALLHAVDPDGDPTTADGADVINMSLGSLRRTRLLRSIAGLVSCEVTDDPPETEDYGDDGYADDKRRCTSGPGAVVVIAAGNDGEAGGKEYPAAETGTYGKLAVAATRPDGTLAPFSNRGSWVNVAAPGERVTSTMAGGTYATWSGTSMAAPLVSATAALLRARYPTMTAQQIVRRIQRTGRPICDQAPRRVDAYAALRNERPNDNDYCR